jgi:hypothetical protein
LGIAGSGHARLGFPFGERLFGRINLSLTLINPNVHVVKDTPIARLFRRVLHHEDMVTFFSLQTGQWILAYWVGGNKRVVEEVEDLGQAVEVVTPEFVQRIKACWKGVDWKAKKRFLVGKQRDRIRKMQDDVLENQEVWDWCKRRNQGQMPYTVDMGRR